MSFVIFTYRKLRAEINEKSFHFVDFQHTDKKFERIFDYPSWKLETFSTKLFFLNVPTIFYSWVTRGLSKKEHSDFITRNSVKNHPAIKNTYS